MATCLNQLSMKSVPKKPSSTTTMRSRPITLWNVATHVLRMQMHLAPRPMHGRFRFPNHKSCLKKQSHSLHDLQTAANYPMSCSWKKSESLCGTLTFWWLAHSFALLVKIKTSITAPPFPCGAHLTWNTQHDFPSCITLNGEHACARFIFTTNNTIRTTTSGARLVWSHCCPFRIQNHMKSSLGINPPLASKSWKHP